jgi:hypothetical protein
VAVLKGETNALQRELSERRVAGNRDVLDLTRQVRELFNIKWQDQR